MTGAMAQQYDFSAVSDDDTLYYKITDAGTKTVEVVSELSNYPYYNTAPTGSLTIPETVSNNGTNYSVTSIGESAFRACSGFTGSLTIPNSVTSIGESAFSGCSGFTGALTIGNSVTSIGEGAFAGCRGFTGIESKATTPPTAQRDPFYGMYHLSLIVPNAEAVEEYKNANVWNEFANYVYGEDYYTITYNANDGTGNTPAQLAMPNSTLRLNENRFSREDYYFVGWATDSLAIQAEYTAGEEFTPTADITLYAVWSEVFVVRTTEGYDLRYAVNLGTETVTLVGMADQSQAGAADLIIPETVTYNEVSYSVTSIGDYAFSGCYGFDGTLTIPNSVTSIGSEAFSWCRGFTGLTMLRATPPSVESDAFDGTTFIEVNVPAGAKAAYDAQTLNGDVDADDKWQGFTIKESTPTSVESAQAAPFTRVQNTLYFAQPTDMAVYNVSGAMLYSGEVTEYELPSAAGIYIIRTANGSVKVLR